MLNYKIQTNWMYDWFPCFRNMAATAMWRAAARQRSFIARIVRPNILTYAIHGYWSCLCIGRMYARFLATRIFFPRTQLYNLSRTHLARSTSVMAPFQDSTSSFPMNHFYADFPLDKAAQVRADDSQVQVLFESAEAVLMPSTGGKFLARRVEGSSELGLLRDPSTLRGLLPPGNARVFMGLEAASGRPLFAVEVSGVPTEGWVPDGYTWVAARAEGPMMEAGEAALMATAAGLLSWHSRTRYCSRCGGRLVPIQGGHAVSCSGGGKEGSGAPCRSTEYPRTDPATISLVTCGDYLLLGRKADWAPCRYSLLAGFVELGETLEQGVAREVLEESGVRVDPGSIRYHSSQPWPFPRSLMLGMQAEAVWHDPSERITRGCHGASSSPRKTTAALHHREGRGYRRGPRPAGTRYDIGS